MDLFESIHQHVYELMKTQLPSFLQYHSINHTTYVLEKAQLIAVREKVSHHDMLLIKLGALFHDTGFTRHYKNHEEAGCEIAVEILKQFHFDTGDTFQICDMIMATKIPQAPATLNARIVCDADLEYLGTDLFTPTSNSLFHELQYINPELGIKEFNRIQVAFISNHSYHTHFCKMNREEKKWQNLKELMQQM